jgi:hypothetical protein
MLDFFSHSWVQRVEHRAMASTIGGATWHGHLINHDASTSRQFNWCFCLCRWWLLVMMVVKFQLWVMSHDPTIVCHGPRSYMISGKFVGIVRTFRGSEVFGYRTNEQRQSIQLKSIWDIGNRLNEVFHFWSHKICDATC